MKKYFYFNVKKCLAIDRLVTIEYLTLRSGFFHEMESHKFQELVCVIKGELLYTSNENTMKLNEGTIYITADEVPHSYRVDIGGYAKVMIICFKSRSELLGIFDSKLNVTAETASLLDEIFEESKRTFKFPFEQKLELLQSPAVGGQQLVENYIEQLLIFLVREKLSHITDCEFVSTNKELTQKLTEEIKRILKNGLYNKLTLSDISRHTFYSKTFLNSAFKKNTGKTIMSYYGELKIKEAERLLKSDDKVATVSEKLNFDNPNYFSKVFKKHTGMSPSEYRSKE